MNRGWVIGAVVVALIAVPGVVVAAVLEASPPAVLEQQQDFSAIVVPTGDGTVTGVQPVGLELTWTAGRSAVSAGGEGTITAVSVKAGDTVGNGDRVATVGATPVVALVAPGPLYRDLAAGDEGPDVTAVAQLLAALDYLDVDDVDDHVDAAISAGIGRYNRAVGIDRIRRSSSGTVIGPEFDRTTTVWVGRDALAVGEVVVQAGLPWPGAGSPVLTARSRVTGLRLAATPDGPALPHLDAGWQVSVGDRLVLELDDDGYVTAKGRAQLGEVADPDEARIDGSLRRREPLQASTLPPSAVVTDVDGRQCVFVPTGQGQGQDQGFEPRPVRLLGAEFSTSLVEPLDVERVLANPAQLLTDPSCG